LLQHPTIDRLRELGLEGMAKSLRDLATNPESKALDHMEWLGILLEHEMTLRQQKRFEARARTAKLRHLASVEDIDYRAARGLDRTLFLKLAGCDWIREHRHCLLTGPCGVGKSWLACALGFKACRENLSVLYQRVPRLFTLLALGRGDGRYAKLMRQLGRVDLLILDLCAARSDVELEIRNAAMMRVCWPPAPHNLSEVHSFNRGLRAASANRRC
jgi:DNA replication protein DnaC